MNPNSAHQCWSLWEYTVVPERRRAVSFPLVQSNTARFGRKAFGSTGQLQVRRAARAWRVRILTEGAPIQDPTYVRWMHAQWRRFFRQGFGAGATITSRARLLAGQVDSRPPDQLILLPSLVVKEL
jgi:hypothetical protein